MSNDERLAKLERKNIWLTGALTLFMVLALAGFGYQSTARWSGNNAQVDGNTSFRATTSGINMGANSITFGTSFSDTSSGSLSAGLVKVANGTAAAPSVTFANDTDTGLYRVSANSLGVSIGGTLRLTGSTTSFTSTLPWLAPNGTAAAPSLSFSGDTDTGIYRSAANELSVASGGNRVAAFASTGAGGHLSISSKICAETGMSGATVTATNCIPAGSFVIGVSVYVDTAITGASSFDVGDGTDADRWGNNIALDADTTTSLADLVGTGVAIFTSANDVVLTAVTSNFTAGAVTITIHYLSINAGT